MAVVIATASCHKGSGARSGVATGPLVIEYVPIAVAWVRRYVEAPPAEVKKWSTTAAGRAAAARELRQVVVAIADPKKKASVEAARRRAQTVVKRIRDGEDPAGLARRESDDGATREAGGAVGVDPSKLPAPLREAAAALGPGDVTPTPVRNDRAFYVLTRDVIDEADLERLYRAARAPELARKLAEEVLARMENIDDPVATIYQEAVGAILGEKAVQDPKRHPAGVVPVAGAGQADLPPDAQKSLASFARNARAGDITSSPLGEGPVFLAARAVSR